jgi:hypothetical protein
MGTAGAVLADNVFNGLASLKTYGINADFEDPELAHNDDAEATTAADIGPGWTVNVVDGNSSNFGVQDPNATFYGFQSVGGPLIAPFEGRQIGFVNTDSAATADVLSKSLGTIQSGQSYSLNVAVGVRTGTTWSEAYEIGLQTLGGVDVGTFASSGAMNGGQTSDLSYNLSSGQSAAFVGQEVSVVIRNHNTNPLGAFSQGNFDNVRLTGTFGDAVFPILTIDRGTGNASLSKTGPDLDGFNGYELGSDAGSFDTGGWLSITDNYDSGGTVDSDDAWTETSAAGTFLAEAQLSIPAGDGGTLSSAVNFGNIWLRTPFEDVSGALLTTDSATRTVQVEYVGDPIPVGDLTGDADVTGADWTAFKNGQGTDFAGLTSAQAYLLGDLDDNGTHDLSDFLLFRSAYETFNGAGSFATLLSVPEPGTAILLLCTAIGSLTCIGRWRSGNMRVAIVLLIAFGGLLTCSDTATAARKVDRLYQFGEDSLEGDTASGLTLGAAPNSQVVGSTLDSEGTTNQDFQDLVVTGGTYVDTFALGRPGAMSGELGAGFDGIDDFVQTSAGSGSGFNNPSIAPSSIFNDPPGSVDYSSIINRGFQVWLLPNAGGNTGGNTQYIVHDTDEHGIRISAGGNWEMRYRSTTFNTGVPVDAFDQWHHVMLVIPHGIGGVAAENDTDGAVMYVDGIAVGAIGGNYDYDENTELVVGANLAGTNNFFNGTLDQLEVFAWGRTANGVDHGTFNLADDNWFVNEFLNGVAGDINQSGSVEQGDINALVAGYGSSKFINGVRTGDLTTYPSGDLNFDGITDLSDVNLLIDALPGSGAGSGLDTSGLLRIIQGVPEPSSLLLALMAAGAFTLLRRRIPRCVRPLALLLAVGMVVSLPCTTAQAELLARWSFDSGDASEGINGLDGILHGNATVGNDAERGMVLVLDDVSDATVEGSSHVEILDPTGLLDFGADGPHQGSASVTGWVNSAAFTNHDPIFNQGEWRNGIGVSVKPDNNNALWAGCEGPGCSANTSVNSSPGVVGDGTWQHVAATWNYDTDANTTVVTFYINGEPTGYDAAGVTDGIMPGRVTSPIDNDSDGVGNSRIGLEWRDTGATQRWPFSGMLDDIRVYDEALDQSGIMESMLEPGGPPINLSLYVDPTNGNVTLMNETENPVPINSYRLTSDGAHLNEAGSQSVTVASGFPVGDGTGNGWEPGPNNSDREITEWYLTGNSMIEVGQRFSLGSAFDMSTAEMDRDLAFRYVLDSGSQRGATIFYEAAPGGITGDYNNDGVVNAADYVVWRNNEGTDNVLPNDELGGTIGTDQYNQWRDNFGNGLAGSGSASQTAVPEPSTAAVLAGGMLVAMVRFPHGSRSAVVETLS